MMIVKEDNSRIIGDFLEINGNILYQKQSSKLPNFIKNIRYNYYHSKLIKLVDKFVNSNYILTKNNLVEFFAYVFNNYLPNGSYDIVKFTKYNYTGDIIESCLEFEDEEDKYVCVITINTNDQLFELKAKKTTPTGTINANVFLSQLATTKESCKDIVNIINSRLIISIKNYILSILNAYE